MKPVLVIGAVLTVFGAVVLFKGLSYKSDEAVLQVGEFKASMETRRTIPTWVGAVAVVSGLVLVLSGARRKGS